MFNLPLVPVPEAIAAICAGTVFQLWLACPVPSVLPLAVVVGRTA